MRTSTAQDTVPTRSPTIAAILRGLSLARFVVVLGLVIELLGIIRFVILLKPTVGQVLQYIRQGFLPVIAAIVLFLGCLALLYPAARGNRRALLLATVVLGLLTATVMPFFLSEFAKPATLTFIPWFTTTTLVLWGLTATGFGILATREAFGKGVPATFRDAAGGITLQGAVLGAAVCIWLGMAMVGYAVAQNRPEEATVLADPDATVELTAAQIKFAPVDLEVVGGQTTAVRITNNDGIGHSFDVDALGVHEELPANATTTVVLSPETSGTFEFYCGLPGHKQAGMVGTLSVQ